MGPPDIVRRSSLRGCRRKGGERNLAIGISRGGRSTKIHALVNGKGRPLHFVVTGGQMHDDQVVGQLLQAPQPALAVTADKAYNSKAARQQIKDDGAVPVISCCVWRHVNRLGPATALDCVRG
jgi:hypothetical protein